MTTIADITRRLSELTEAELNTILDRVLWTSYGVDGKGPATQRPLRSLDTDHLENILVTQIHVEFEVRKAILFLLKQRYLAPTTTVSSC